MNQHVYHDADIDLTEDNTTSNIILLQANNARARYVLPNVIYAYWTGKCLGIDKRSLPPFIAKAPKGSLCCPKTEPRAVSLVLV